MLRRVPAAGACTILVYSVYLFGLGAALLFVPNIPLPIFGLPEAHEVWIRVLGMTVIFFSSFYYVASRNEYRELFRASVVTRLAVPIVFGSFIVAGFAPWNLILFTPPDVLFALWTWSALRGVRQMAPSSASRMSTARWRGGSTWSAVRNASEMDSRAS